MIYSLDWLAHNWTYREFGQIQLEYTANYEQNKCIASLAFGLNRIAQLI